MLTFNLDLSANTLVIPLFGLQVGSGNTYTLQLTSSALGGSGVTYLLTDQSPDPGKYQQFTLITSGYTMALGDYAYAFLEGVTDNVLGIGRWVTVGRNQVKKPLPAYENPNAGTYGSYKNPMYAKTT